MRPDERRKARKNRRRIHWNTLRIFQDRERRRWSWIIRRSRTVNVGQAPENFLQVGDGLVLRRMASFLPLESYVPAKKHIDSWFSLQKERLML
jgi:hypothetical protein